MWTFIFKLFIIDICSRYFVREGKDQIPDPQNHDNILFLN